MSPRLALPLVAAVLLAPLSAAAQARGAPGATLHFAAPSHFAHGHFFHNDMFLGGPFFYPDFFPDYPYQPPPPPPPQIVIVQVPSPSSAEKQEPHQITPLLIERQGDRFVRLTGNEDEASESARVAESNTPSINPKPQPPELPPTLLVFRDGHAEETSNYAIVGNILYESADYWTGGAWTKRIQIADLDISATLRRNQDRGVKFVLPGGPNQVVTRP